MQWHSSRMDGRYLVEQSKQDCNQWNVLGLNNVSIINSAIDYSPSGLRRVFDDNKINCDLDVLFLDIDGGEYQPPEGFLDDTYRPKIICVEYDNAFPLSINYIPSSICHGRQASSIAFYKLMASAGYLYMNTFWHDHIFVDEFFVKKLHISTPTFETFTQIASTNLYQFDRVCLNQRPATPDSGVQFYESKINLLISEAHPCAAHYYSYVAGGINACISLLAANGKVHEDYAKIFSSAGLDLIRKYSSVLM